MAAFSGARKAMRLGIVYHMPFWRDADGRLREVEGSFARYVDSLAPYFDEIVLCVPVLREASGEGTAVRSRNVTLAPLTDFDGPMRFYPRLPRLLPRLLRFARHVDVLHCRVPTPAAIFAFAFARLLGRPAFVLIVGDLAALRESVAYRGLKRWLWRAYTAFEERNVQWMADRSLAFANGAALAKKHSRMGRTVIETQTTTIGLADVADREDTCAGSRARVLTVSRIDPRKGLRVLPDVVSQLVARRFDVALDVVGPVVGAPGEDERRAIAARAAALGVEDRFRLLGAVPLDRLLPLYRQYDLFVLPTLPGEGIPRVLLEAMTAGVPVVTTRVAGIPSLVAHGVNGLLVNEPTPSAVADALACLLSDAGLRRRLIANGYETARAHTLEAQAARMMREVSSRLHVTLREPAAAPAA
jgi:glycosyltransferase involved in cell wall biosynthesis